MSRQTPDAAPAADGEYPRTARVDRLFANISSRVAKAAGRPATFIVAALIVIAWGATGPLFHLSDTWQLIMNTISSIITFLMVFLIQNTQARDSEATQAKLDTIIAALDKADNRYLRIERLPDKDIENIRARYGPGRGIEMGNDEERGPA